MDARGRLGVKNRKLAVHIFNNTEQREKTGSVARVLISKPSPGDILPPCKVPVTEDQVFKY